MGDENDEVDEFGFDCITVQTSTSQSKSAKRFSAERRRVKPTRKHVASTNPVKSLQNRKSYEEDVVDYDEEDLFNGIEDIDNEELADLNDLLDNIMCKSSEKEIMSDHTQENGDINFHEEFEDHITYEPKSRDQNDGEEGLDENRYKNQPQIIGRRSNINIGKTKEREVSLSVDAKKGLESKEDIHAATQKLRITEKDAKTGIGTEKTNIYDGVKDVMLFHIKGARHVQTRLVEPKSSSLNSGDVFVLVTAKHVIQWNGKNCSIMEKARGAEVSSVIYQWKELRCNANNADVIDEGHEKAGSKSSTFWKILGNKDKVKDIDDVFEDKEFEKSILETNRFYEIKCKEEENEDAECWVELIEVFSGKVPSKKWLQTDKAYVLDFGSEVYSWIGRHCSGAPRWKAVDLGLNIFNEGYKIDSVVHPFNLNESGIYGSELLPRPNWSVYGRMAEKTENVLFRRKFFDWPDPVSVEVNTVAAKVHSQLNKEFSISLPNSSLIPAEVLMKPPDEPLMIIEGNFIGRGKGMRDEETLFSYGVTTTKLTVWEVSGTLYEELPLSRYGVLYSGEAYYMRWNYEIFRTGIRHLKGGKSRQEDLGKSRILFFFWQGKDCTSSEKGLAALRTMELSSDEGPQIPVVQGKEHPAFSQLFDGKMIVHANKFSDDTEYSRRYRMYFVKSEVKCETCLVEIKMCSSSLRSRGSFIVVNMDKLVMYIWHGIKSLSRTQKNAVNCAKNLKNKTIQQFDKCLRIYEMMEGEEADDFWNCFEDDEDYMSYLEVKKGFDFTPRCFSFDSLHGDFRHVELISSTYHPDYVCPFPILQSDLYDLSQPGLVFIDSKYKLYLWQGWWPVVSDEDGDISGPNTMAEKHRFDVNRKLALQSIKDYAEKAGRSLRHAYIVFAGCEPLDFKNLFPFWEDDADVLQCQLEAGRAVGERLEFLKVLNQLEKEEYTLAELKETPLPEGVDPTRIEQYLGKAEFQELFGMGKEDFKNLPRWKQIELKKKTGFF